MTALLRPPARRRPEAAPAGLPRAAAAARRRSEAAPARPQRRAATTAGPATRSKAPVQARQRAGFLASGLLFTAVLVGNVTVHASITQGQFELERLQDTAAQREATYQRLRLEVAEAEAPGRIVGRARRLGMVEPASVTYLTPTTKTSSTDLASGSTAGDSPAEAAQSWGRVKPHLDGRR